MNNSVVPDACVVQLNPLNYRMAMIEVFNNLRRSDTDALKFLCSDFIPVSKLERIKNGCSLVQALEQLCLISQPNNVYFLAELLWLIQRIDLLQKLNTSRDDVRSLLSDSRFQHVSTYR